jgi:anti-anti-sigma factor
VSVETDRVVHLALHGELDMVGTRRSEREVAAVLTRRADTIVLHLGEVTFIDSTGLRMLLAAAETASDRGIELRILPGPAPVMDVVDAAGLGGRLPFVGWP